MRTAASAACAIFSRFDHFGTVDANHRGPHSIATIVDDRAPQAPACAHVCEGHQGCYGGTADLIAGDPIYGRAWVTAPPSARKEPRPFTPRGGYNRSGAAGLGERLQCLRLVVVGRNGGDGTGQGCATSVAVAWQKVTGAQRRCRATGRSPCTRRPLARIVFQSGQPLMCV